MIFNLNSKLNILLKKIKFLILISGIFSLYSFSSALIITEINFDPAGTDTNREWVEVYNDSSTSINFSTYKFFEAGVNHGLTAVGDVNLAAGEYAIIVQDAAAFMTDYPGNSSKLFKSSFSLSNSGETLSIKNSGGTVVDARDYNPATTGAGSGLSEQLESGVWSKGNPSPGAVNILIPSGSGTDTSTTTSTTTATTSIATTTIVYATVTATVTEIDTKIVYVAKSYWPTSEKIYVNAGENKIVLAGAETEFVGRVIDSDKKSISTGEFSWSFGDGYSIHEKKAKHYYRLPGEYTAIFEARDGERVESDRIYVKVMNPEISIKLGKDFDKNKKEIGYIEITNNNREEINLSNFILREMGEGQTLLKTFIVPKNLSILPKKSIKIVNELTGFSDNPKEVGLYFSDGSKLSSLENPNYEKNKKLELENNSKNNLLDSEIFSPATNTVSVYTLEEYNKLKNFPVVVIASKQNSTATNKPKTLTVKKLNSNPNNYSKILQKSESVESDASGEEKLEKSTSSKVILTKQKASFWQEITNLLGL